MSATIAQLPQDPGPAAWDAILPAAIQRPELTEQRTADWLIVGAGFAGLSAARRLSELHPQSRIVVLEATRIAQGASGRNSGFMIDVPHDLTSSNYAADESDQRLQHTHREIRLNRAAIDYALAAREEFAMPDEAIRLSGKINGAMSARGQHHNDLYAEHLNHLGEASERLDAQAMFDVTGTRCYCDGLFSPGSAMLQPALYTRSLAAGIEANGVACFENSPATAFVEQGNEWCVSTPRGSITAPRVILTVNGHLQSFGFFKRHLVHVFTYGSMTRALTPDEVKRLGGHSNWALTPADALGTTVRRVFGIGGDRIVVRNRATYDPSMQVSEKRIAQVAQTHDESFRQRFPMLGDVDMEYRWGGRLCLARNGGTVFGEIADGIFSACCQNGLGTARGTIGGKLVAELASDQTSDLLRDQQALELPNKLPPGPIAALGATAQLRWGEFRAGREL